MNIPRQYLQSAYHVVLVSARTAETCQRMNNYLLHQNIDLVSIMVFGYIQPLYLDLTVLADV